MRASGLQLPSGPESIAALILRGLRVGRRLCAIAVTRSVLSKNRKHSSGDKYELCHAIRGLGSGFVRTFGSRSWLARLLVFALLCGCCAEGCWYSCGTLFGGYRLSLTVFSQ